MHIHILGICGTFMGSLALLARQLGYKVSGSDANVYPPMSTQLEEAGIEIREGFDPAHLQPVPNLVVIGNALSRGNPAVEFVLDEGLPYTSGPACLAQYLLPGKWVLGVSGTHGKTTTSAMLAWILEYAGLKPGFLIGGVTNNFAQSARIGDSPFFVVEADEYDSAFFDKRSKFIHYAPRTLIINNIEFDHADIFPDLEAIETQFHHLVRTVPGNGLIVTPQQDSSIEAVLARGAWSPRQQFGIEVPEEICRRRAANGRVFWNASLHSDSGMSFELTKYGQGSGGGIINRATVEWELSGIHNVQNAVAAVAAAHHVGVNVSTGAEALQRFAGVKRRLELRGTVEGVRLYDDFAHHPTAIRLTLEGLARRRRDEGEQGRLIAVIEPRSNTMRMGLHQGELSAACAAADMVVWSKPEGASLDYQQLLAESSIPAYAFSQVSEIVGFLEETAQPGDTIVVMSNGGFEGIHDRILKALRHDVARLN